MESARCTRLAAALVRFLHYHVLCSDSPGAAGAPRVHLDLPPFYGDGAPSAADAFFTENVRAACGLLQRPLSISHTGSETTPSPLCSPEEASSTSSKPAVIISFFPYPDEDRAVALSAWAAEQLVVPSSKSADARTSANGTRGMLFVVCGDCEALGVPGSSAEEEERGLDALRVEMLLKKHLSSAFTSGAAIAVEYARGGSDGARAREENCRLRRQQRAQMVNPGQDLLLLSEKWHVFVARGQLEAEAENSATSSQGETLWTPRAGRETAGAREAARPSSAAVAKFRAKLHDWIRKRLEHWDAAEGPAKTKLLRKYSTRGMFEKQICLAAALRFEQRTGLSDLFAVDGAP